jgi:hypothetical protein
MKIEQDAVRDGFVIVEKSELFLAPSLLYY